MLAQGLPRTWLLSALCQAIMPTILVVLSVTYVRRKVSMPVSFPVLVAPVNTGMHCGAEHHAQQTCKGASYQTKGSCNSCFYAGPLVTSASARGPAAVVRCSLLISTGKQQPWLGNFYCTCDNLEMFSAAAV